MGHPVRSFGPVATTQDAEAAIAELESGASTRVDAHAMVFGIDFVQLRLWVEVDGERWWHPNAQATSAALRSQLETYLLVQERAGGPLGLEMIHPRDAAGWTKEVPRG